MIHFELVALDGTKFGEEVYEVILPTPDGQIAILPHHVPLVSMVSPGVISVRKREGDSDNKMDHFATNGGVIEILDNMVRVLVDEADHADEINEQEVKKAYDQAQKILAEAKDHVELQEAQSLVDRHATRLKVAELRRHRKQRY